jgi:hypothetical protein
VTFDWDDGKNELLRITRDIPFEEIVVAIEEGHVNDVLEHLNKTRYPNQEIYLVAYRDYVHVVPFVRDPSNAERDLKRLETRAAEEGIPYQTLVTMVLHKYVTGQLKEKR